MKTIYYKKGNKYNNQSHICALNHQHDSRMEADYCFQLQALKQAGEIKDFQYEKRYELRVNGKLICTHKPDFLVTDNDGSEAVHEVKGFATAVWAIKHKLFEACYPDIPYIVIR